MPVPSKEYDRYSPPQHCFCRCMWVYVNKEGWKPDDDWDGEVTKRPGGIPPDDLIDRNGHANSTWEKSPKKGDNEVGVTYRTMEREAKKAFSTKREKPPETTEIVTELPRGAIIEERAVNVWIDELTPCLFDSKTGETVKTNHKPISSLSEIKKVQKEQAWEFDWVKEWGRREKGSEIYKLTLNNDAQTQGIIHLVIKMGFVEAKTAESAPHNRAEVVGAENQKYKGVGAHLFAIAVKRSIEEGNGGYVGFTSVTSRVEQYKKMLNAGIVGRAPEGGTRMEINEKYARMLYNKYFGETP